MSHIRITKGHNLKLSGSPKKEIVEVHPSSIFKLHPIEFSGIKPKLLIHEGDLVKIGTPIYFDKNHSQIKFTSPVAGKIHKIFFGNRRRIETIEILTSDIQESINYDSFNLEDISSISADKIQNILYNSGFWPCIRRRPFSKIADPDHMPKSIFISAAPTAPFSPDYDFIFDHSSKGFQAGINILKQFTDCDIHLVINKNSKSSILKNTDNIILHTFEGPHPAGNVGVHIYHIDPIKNRDDTIWYISPQDVMSIGKLFLQGKPDFTKIITVAGNPFKERQYYKIIRGTLISNILMDNVVDNNARLISGDVLSGVTVNTDKALGFYHETLTAIYEGTRREFLGWITPGYKKYSITRAFLSTFISKKEKQLTTNKHGSIRSMIPIGNIEKVMPINILTTLLLKAVLSKDVDTMESLGIYECAPEDFSLCTFVDASKMNLAHIIQEGLDFIESEG